MKKRRLLLVFCISYMCGIELFAQESAALLRQACRFEEHSDWISAASCYELYLADSVAGATEACWHYAHCLQKLYEYRQAESMFRRVWRQDSVHYPDARYYLAMAKKNNAEYVEAGRLFDLYIRSGTGDRSLRDRAVIERNACAWASDALLRPHNCQLQRLPVIVNSPYSESNARPSGDSLLLFSSLQPVTRSGDGAMLGSYYASAIYRARITPGGFTGVRRLPPMINHPQYNNANICFNADHTRLYMTRSRVTEPISGSAEIWISELKGGKWQKPYRLGEPVNIPGTVSTQPFSTTVNGQEVLYFVSDREGGFGACDIWYAFLEEDGSFRSVVNLGGVVNTAGNELTPFYDTVSGKLYFSSDFHPGFGGFDVFSVRGGLNGWEPLPENLGYPLNSPANEVYFVCSEGGRQGYFASNRNSELDLTDAGCCNDIYYFSMETVDEKSTVTDTIMCKAFRKTETDASRKAAAMLPLTLYFHNDEPDPRCVSDTTELDYYTTLALYLAMLPVYVKEYSDGLGGPEADSARECIKRFFKDSLSGRYRQLQRFMELLREDLESGNRVSLKVEGHASPLFSDNYNMHLSSRRIVSLWNSMSDFGGGCFVPYFRSGALRFERDPIGKRQARSYVSDNPDDLRNSVYSVAAALERRIRIVGYNSVPETAVGTDSRCLLPDTAFVLREHPGAGRYCFRIQLWNLSGDTMRVGFVSGEPDLECKAETPVLPPHSCGFVSVSFESSLFVAQPGRKAVLEWRTVSESGRIPVSFSFFKRK